MTELRCSRPASDSGDGSVVRMAAYGSPESCGPLSRFAPRSALNRLPGELSLPRFVQHPDEPDRAVVGLLDDEVDVSPGWLDRAPACDGRDRAVSDRGARRPCRGRATAADTSESGTTVAATDIARHARRELDRLVHRLAEAAPADDPNASAEDDPSSKELPDAAILRSLPGIGTKVLATLVAEGSDAVGRRDYNALRCL